MSAAPHANKPHPYIPDIAVSVVKKAVATSTSSRPSGNELTGQPACHRGVGNVNSTVALIYLHGGCSSVG